MWLLKTLLPGPLGLDGPVYIDSGRKQKGGLLAPLLAHMCTPSACICNQKCVHSSPRKAVVFVSQLGSRACISLLALLTSRTGRRWGGGREVPPVGRPFVNVLLSNQSKPGKSVLLVLSSCPNERQVSRSWLSRPPSSPLTLSQQTVLGPFKILQFPKAPAS